MNQPLAPEGIEAAVDRALRTRTSATPRLAFVGLGWIGAHRMTCVRDSKFAEIGAILEPDPEMRAKAQAEVPQAHVLQSFDDLWSLDLDGIVIATPSALHASQSIAALEHGLAVFCQKPLGRTAVETEAVIHAARRADRLLAVDLSYRHTEALRQLRALVQAQALGDIYAVELVFHNAYGPDKPWFYERERSGGGCIMDLGVHLVDALLWMLDYPAVTDVHSRVFCGGQPLRLASGDGNAPVEDFATARIDLATGAVAQLSCSWRLPVGQDALIGMHVYGTRGGAALKNVGGSFYDFVLERYDGTRCERLVSPPDAWGGRAVTEFASRLGLDPSFDPQAASLVVVANVLDAIYAACG